MSNFQIKNLKTPINPYDAVNKKYFDEELLKSHLISSHIENAFKYLSDQDESSSENNIIVNGIVDFNESPHKNKKAYSIDLVYTAGTQNYKSQIGINLYPLSIGKYTFIMEYFFPEDTNISLAAGSLTAIINKQVTTSSSDHKKLLVQFDQQSKDTPDYLFLVIRGSATTSTNPEGYLVFYGVKGWMESVPPEIYDRALETGMFEYDGGKMKMNMDLDLNGNSLKGANSPFFIQGWYDKKKAQYDIFINPVHNYQIIPCDCILKKICFYSWLNLHPILSLTLSISVLNKSSTNVSFRSHANKAEIDVNLSLNKNDVIEISFAVEPLNNDLKYLNQAVFAFYFTSR